MMVAQAAARDSAARVPKARLMPLATRDVAAAPPAMAAALTAAAMPPKVTTHAAATPLRRLRTWLRDGQRPPAWEWGSLASSARASATPDGDGGDAARDGQRGGSAGGT